MNNDSKGVVFAASKRTECLDTLIFKPHGYRTAVDAIAECLIASIQWHSHRAIFIFHEIPI